MRRGGRGGRAEPGPTLPERIDALETALDAGRDRLPAEAVRQAQAVLSRTSERLRLGAGHTVVALAGATGSGKSSLFNAVAGMEITEVGVRRPTTGKPVACVWGEGADELLGWLEVPRRHRVSRMSVLDADRESALEGLVLLDLPDHDSTAMAHRLEVDRLVQLVDLLIWVVDPQKYADDALHTSYLRPLAGHQDVMLVVLNQVDRLTADAAQACVDDLHRLLEEDGLAGVRVLPVSARRGDGVSELRSILAEAVTGHASVVARSEADLRRAARALAAGVGAAEPDSAASGDDAVLVEALADAAGVPVVLDAVERDYRRQALGATGWPFSRWARRLRPDPMDRFRLGGAGTLDPTLSRSSLPDPTASQLSRVSMAARRVAQSCTQGLPAAWSDAVRDASDPPAADLADALDQAVTGVDLDTRRPRWWAVLGFVQTLLALAAVAGALWLAALAGLAYLRLPDPPTPTVEGLPVPTLMLVGGLLAGVLLALLSRWVARARARARRRRVSRRLHDAVRQVATAMVLEPVQAVLQEHRSTRQSLELAGRPDG